MSTDGAHLNAMEMPHGNDAVQGAMNLSWMPVNLVANGAIPSGQYPVIKGMPLPLPVSLMPGVIATPHFTPAFPAFMIPGRMLPYGLGYPNLFAPVVAAVTPPFGTLPISRPSPQAAAGAPAPVGAELMKDPQPSNASNVMNKMQFPGCLSSENPFQPRMKTPKPQQMLIQQENKINKRKTQKKRKCSLPIEPLSIACRARYGLGNKPAWCDNCVSKREYASRRRCAKAINNYSNSLNYKTVSIGPTTGSVSPNPPVNRLSDSESDSDDEMIDPVSMEQNH